MSSPAEVLCKYLAFDKGQTQVVLRTSTSCAMAFETCEICIAQGLSSTVEGIAMEVHPSWAVHISTALMSLAMLSPCTQQLGFHMLQYMKRQVTNSVCGQVGPTGTSLQQDITLHTSGRGPPQNCEKDICL